MLGVPPATDSRVPGVQIVRRIVVVLAAFVPSAPNTGSGPRLLGLLGIAWTPPGVGLRLRTADVDLC